MHGASAESAPWLSAVNEGPACAIKNRMGCEEVEGTKGRRETRGQLSVPLPISTQMDIKNVKRFTRAKETKAPVPQLVCPTKYPANIHYVSSRE